eukprot:8270767-Alexandrium_andersonii.AAC.1
MRGSGVCIWHAAEWAPLGYDAAGTGNHCVSTQDTAHDCKSGPTIVLCQSPHPYHHSFGAIWAQVALARELG